MSIINRRFFVAATATGAVLAATATARAQTAMPSGNTALPSPTARDGKTVVVNGAKIFYGVAGQGSPLLLIHGYPLSGALFSRVVNLLAQNHMVITPDLRGYGQSSAPAVTDTVDVYVADMIALMDQLGLKTAAVAGMSMGGAIALGMYKKAPSRFSGLVLIDTTFKEATPAEAGLWRGVEIMAQKGELMPTVQLLLPQMLTGETRMNDRGQVAYLTAIITQASTTGLVSGARALYKRLDATPVLSTISVPTLVVVGEDDPLYGFESARMMQQQISGAQLHIVPGAAHAAIFEMPEDAGGAIAKWAAATIKAS